MQLRYFFLGLSILAFQANGQQRKDNSLHPSETIDVSIPSGGVKKKSRFFSPGRAKQTRFKKPNVKNTARYEFYERVEKAAKEKQRILRKLSKPAYSDPRYFGHKKIPKRRSPARMRYCGECGIRH
jgi:hypothetical protein